MTSVVSVQRGSESDRVGEPERGSEYAGLSRAVRSARLLDRTPWRYSVRAVLTAGFFAGCWWLTVLLGPSWWVLVPAAVLGVASTQVAFLGHDSGHQQIGATRRANRWLSLLTGNLLSGLSTSWWADKHNRHHANPNREDHDPDIGEGVLAFTVTHAANRTSSVARAITRNQAVLFFPLLLLEGLNLHVASVRHLCRPQAGRLRRAELALLALHGLAYVGGLLLVLSPVHALVFVAVHQAVFGFYMGCSFAPNHKGMPIIASHQKLDYLRRQVLTSRNIKGGWLVDQLLGGLNYQIEHHLFPNMPRANLRRAQRLVREHCAQHQIPYAETGLFSSYAIVLRYLHALGAPLRAARHSLDRV